MNIEFGDTEFRALLIHFNRSWKGYRKVRKGVMRRIRGHMRELQVSNLRDYLTAIEDTNEREKCKFFLLVTISRFFRDRHLWKILQSQVLPELQDRFKEGVRCWSAGCASGEEPYSLAMLGKLLGCQAPFEVVATDKNKICLTRARLGVFSLSSLREVGEENRKRFFTKQTTGDEYLIDPLLKERISFLHHELMDELPSGTFHLIMLRNNLLTYHQGRNRDIALKRIVEKIEEGGTLVIGSHEKLPQSIDSLKQDSRCKFLFKHVVK